MILFFVCKLYADTPQFYMSTIDQKRIAQFIGEHGEGELLRLVINATEQEKPREVVQPPEFALPWTGVVVKSCCKGLRGNYGCFLQCTNEVSKGGEYCKTCQKSADQNDGVPKFGNVEMRIQQADRFIIEGKKPVHYNAFMKKQKDLTQERVIQESKKYGIDLDTSFFEVKKVVGRPKKEKQEQELTLNALVNDSESEDDN